MCNLKTAAWQEAKLSRDLYGHFVFLVAICFCSSLKKKKNLSKLNQKFITTKKKLKKKFWIVGELHNFLCRDFACTFFNIYFYFFWTEQTKKIWNTLLDMSHVHVTYHMSCVTCHVAHVMCHMRCVSCHMSHATCHMALIFSCPEQL